jgi:hypothetical protein
MPRRGFCGPRDDWLAAALCVRRVVCALLSNRSQASRPASRVADYGQGAPSIYVWNRRYRCCRWAAC